MILGNGGKVEVQIEAQSLARALSGAPGIDLVGVDRVVFGSDYPHIEGMSEPLSYVDELEGLSHDEMARVMGGNLAEAMKVPFAA